MKLEDLSIGVPFVLLGIGDVYVKLRQCQYTRTVLQEHRPEMDHRDYSVCAMLHTEDGGLSCELFILKNDDEVTLYGR